MTATLLLAGALLAQSTAMIEPRPANVQEIDVAYEAMSRGETDAAIAQLRARPARHPATLINLGTAYARKGMRQEAAAYFQAALASGDHFELQLADGSWMDSRRAARLALARLERNSTFTMR